jgi:deoxyadenosine/deoxycytidine kinase
MPGKLIIVEGNIGVGKSTLCKSLSERLNYVLFLEPTTENPFLEKYYKEPKKYALPLQV